jgi:hypothetical protein
MEARDLIGTWEQIGMEFRDQTGKLVRKDTDVKGLIIYSTDGHMAVAIEAPEARGEMGKFTSYTGRYEVSGNTVKHHIMLSSNPKLAGTTQVRMAEVAGDRLNLKAERSLAGGPNTSSVIQWRRVKRAQE